MTERTPEQIEWARLEQRRKWVMEVAPLASRTTCSERDFNTEFRTRWYYANMDVLRNYEKENHVLHCTACREEEDKACGYRVKATRLVIRFEEDILKNFPAVMHGYCANCGAEEMVGVQDSPTIPKQHYSLKEIAEMFPNGRELVQALIRNNPEFLQKKPFSPLGEAEINRNFVDAEIARMEQERRKHMYELKRTVVSPLTIRPDWKRDL